MCEKDGMSPTLYMAPIRGITNCVYRNTYAGLFHGYDRAITPFIKNASVSSPRHKLLRDLFPERNNVPFTLVPQVLTKRAREFINAARHIYALGYAGINWNLGCPHKRIRSRSHGSGMLSHPEQLLRILDEVLPRIENTVSLKVRLGSEDKTELPRLLPALNGYPISEIIIHPRTGEQMYGGQVDIDAFEDCLSRTKHSVIFNGDINSVQVYARVRERFPDLSTWMIGRGGIINPFLAEEIRSGTRQSADLRLERYKSLHDRLFAAFEAELSGWSHLAGKMKEYWYYWSQAFANGPRLMHAVARATHKTQYITLVERFFAEGPRLLI